MKIHDSISDIRRRLFTLQLRSFIYVVLAIMVLIWLAMIWTVSRSVNLSPLEKLPVVARLEGYYLGNGQQWAGVEQVIGSESDTDHGFWDWKYLVDKNGFIVASKGSHNKLAVGDPYTGRYSEFALDLSINGMDAGKLIFSTFSFTNRFRIMGVIMLPLIGISFILIIFLIVSNYYIVRRIVNPLAYTIAAAREVAAGNLSARVNVVGPDDLNVLNGTFNQMVASLEESNTQRREFLADIAHELRTPLTIMRGRLEGILDGVYQPDESHIAPILQETYLLERLVDDLRTLTLAETRQLHLDRKIIDLSEVVKTSLVVFTGQAENSQIELDGSGLEDSVQAYADHQRVEQVIGNVLDNALRHVPAGGRIEITTFYEKDRAIIEISDNGPGVPAEDLELLFDRFWRKDKSRSRQTGGSGLGLAISKQLVEAQGGTIIARNCQPSGLCIRIELPVNLP